MEVLGKSPDGGRKPRNEERADFNLRKLASRAHGGHFDATAFPRGRR